MREFDRITVDPNIANGLPCIRDTGITVSEVVKKVTYEKTMDEVLDLYPMLEYEDLVDALAYQVERLRGFVSGIAADFRSPLATIEGAAPLLQMTLTVYQAMNESNLLQ